MGLLDTPGMTYADPRIAAWHRLMNEATIDSDVAVLGDSTGVGNTRWPYLLAQMIAAQWPLWTVIWAPYDDTTKSYVAGNKVTIQTGTNGRTVTVWNGSVSGQTIGYATTNVGTLLAASNINMIIFNFGHNSPQLTDDYRAVHALAVHEIAARKPQAAIVQMSQNPRATTDSSYSDDQGRARSVADYATSTGQALIDVNANFRAYGASYATDLLNGDGLHPNDSAGSPRWANLAWSTLRPRSVSVRPGWQPTATRVFIPATAFSSLSGSPALVQHAGIPCWELDPTADESVSAVADYPSAWTRVSVDMIFMTEFATAAPVVVNGARQYIANPNASGSNGSALGTWTSDSGDVTPTTSGTALVPTLATLWNRSAFSSRPVAFRVMRKGSAAGDTNPNDLLFIGLVIQRAS